METIYLSLVHTGSWGYLFHEIPVILSDDNVIYYNMFNVQCTLYEGFYIQSLCTFQPYVEEVYENKEVNMDVLYWTDIRLEYKATS